MEKVIIYVDKLFEDGSGARVNNYDKAIYLLEKLFKEQYELFVNTIIEDQQIEFVMPVGKYICSFTMATRTRYTNVFFLPEMTDAEAAVLSQSYFHTRKQFLLSHQLLKQEGVVGDKEVILVEGELPNTGNN